MTDIHSSRSMDQPGGKRTVLFDGVPFGLKSAAFPTDLRVRSSAFGGL
jgi:hypothetical protein